MHCFMLLKRIIIEIAIVERQIYIWILREKFNAHCDILCNFLCQVVMVAILKRGNLLFVLPDLVLKMPERESKIVVAVLLEKCLK